MSKKKNPRPGLYGAPSAVSLHRPSKVARDLMAMRAAEDDALAAKAQANIDLEERVAQHQDVIAALATFLAARAAYYDTDSEADKAAYDAADKAVTDARNAIRATLKVQP